MNAGDATIAAGLVRIERAERWLVARFAERLRVLSWAPVGAGDRLTSAVAWHEVFNRELDLDTDPVALLRDRMRARGLDDAVGLMTSADLGGYLDVAAAAEGVAVRCIATVGLGNVLRVGDPPGWGEAAGTINLLAVASVPLGEGARLEALSIAAEARTVAVREAVVASRRTGRPATGTGTDCIAIAAPDAGAGAAAADYAGKHTLIGHLLGAAVEEAVRRGVAAWVATHSAG